MLSLTKAYPWVRETKFYDFCLNTVGLALALFMRLRVFNSNEIPEKGPCLIVSNHRSYFDPPIVAYAVRKRHVFFLAKKSLFDIPVLGFLIKQWGNGLPVKRGRFDVKALRSCLEVLNNGKVLCVFLEGTRAREGQFLKPKWGAGMIALKSRVPIVPCLIEGSGKVLPKGSLLPRFNKVTVRFGKPFKLDLADERENYQIASDLMMKRIRELSSENSIS